MTHHGRALPGAAVREGGGAVGRPVLVPAGGWAVVPLDPGQDAAVVNSHGGQVVDTWVFARPELHEHVSMEHSRTAWQRLAPRVGDPLTSTSRRTLMTLAADTSPGAHDTLIAACDPARYAALGVDGAHRTCTGNLTEALASVGQEAAATPSPLNLFMDVRWDGEGALTWHRSPARAGDRVVLRPTAPVWLVLSACPMDVNAINGHHPHDVALEVSSARPGRPGPPVRWGPVPDPPGAPAR